MRTAVSNIGTRMGRNYLIVAILIVFAMLASSPVYAEDLADPNPLGAPVDVTPAAPANSNAESATQPPPDAPIIPEPVTPEPTDPPIVETPVATPLDQPLAPDAPTIPEPVETEVPDQSEPARTNLATPQPTSGSTPMPAPVVTWSQSDPVSCEIRTGPAAGLKYAASRTYRCDVSANVISDRSMPGDMKIEWTLEVEFPDRHTLTFPDESIAKIDRASPGAYPSSTTYTVTHPWQPGSEQKLVFDLVVTRTTCAEGENVLTVQAAPRIATKASDAEIKQSGGAPKQETYITDFLPNLEAPAISMTSVDFGSLEWDGYSWGSSTATSTITVTSNEPCATSQPYVVNLSITSDSPSLMPVLIGMDADGSIATPVDGGGTSIVAIQAGFTGNTSIEVQFQLTPGDDVQVGNYPFGFDLTVTAAP